MGLYTGPVDVINVDRVCSHLSRLSASTCLHPALGAARFDVFPLYRCETLLWGVRSKSFKFAASAGSCLSQHRLVPASA